MAKYLLIESHDPFESGDVHHFYDLAAELARAANQVTVYLTENGVRAARAGEHTFWFAALARIGVQVLADDCSLRERGITAERLSPGVTPTAPGLGLDRLAEGRQTLRR
jgi:sulfur transfer complex TusBCD TusB component (DsrH family)